MIVLVLGVLSLALLMHTAMGSRGRHVKNSTTLYFFWLVASFIAIFVGFIMIKAG